MGYSELENKMLTKEQNGVVKEEYIRLRCYPELKEMLKEMGLKEHRGMTNLIELLIRNEYAKFKDIEKRKSGN